MVVEVTTSDEDERTIYEIPGYPVKVVTEPSAENDEEVFVEVWDEAGCQDRVTRPKDQAQRSALKTLHTEYRADTQPEVVQ